MDRAQLWVDNGQDCRIYRIGCLGLSRGLKMDRITGLQDLQDRVLGLSWGLTMDRITRITG
jgi:hypothetical protein